MNNCNCAACNLRCRNENQDLIESWELELSDEDRKEAKRLLSKILSKFSHETPKVSINKDSGNLCAHNWVHIEGSTYQCSECNQKAGSLA